MPIQLTLGTTLGIYQRRLGDIPPSTSSTFRFAFVQIQQVEGWIPDLQEHWELTTDSTGTAIGLGTKELVGGQIRAPDH